MIYDKAAYNFGAKYQDIPFKVLSVGTISPYNDVEAWMQ